MTLGEESKEKNYRDDLREHPEGKFCFCVKVIFGFIYSITDSFP